jgi:hypothetical protein
VAQALSPEAALAEVESYTGKDLNVIPAVDSYGRRRVMTALLGALRGGTNLERAGSRDVLRRGSPDSPPQAAHAVVVQHQVCRLGRRGIRGILHHAASC